MRMTRIELEKKMREAVSKFMETPDSQKGWFNEAKKVLNVSELDGDEKQIVDEIRLAVVKQVREAK